jgi:hypothetical protein
LRDYILKVSGLGFEKKFGHEGEEVIGDWIMLPDEFHHLYASPNIICVIKEDMMGMRVANIHVWRKHTK